MRIPNTIILPETPRDSKATIGFLELFKRNIINRDSKISRAINNHSIDIVSAQPADPPEFPAPVLRLYKNGTTWQLWVYTGDDGWQHVNLS